MEETSFSFAELTTEISYPSSMQTTSRWINVLNNVTLNYRKRLSTTAASGSLPDDLSGPCRLAFCTGQTEGVLARYCRIKYPNIVEEIEVDEILSQQISDTARVILILLFTIIIIVSVIGNLLVIVTFIVNQNMRSVTNIFILSLAISDLFVILVTAPINMSTAINKFWTMSSFACKLVPFLITFNVACSTLTLCCIAFDRYYAIVHPLKLKLLQTPTRAFILQIIVWTISGVASIPYCLFFDKIDHAACLVADEEHKYLCKMTSHESLRVAYETWVTPIILYLGPFLIMSGLYAVICHKLWIQRPVGARTNHVTYDGRLRLKKKAIKMLITVVIIFALCWTPILCFNGIARKYDLQITSENLSWKSFLQCLALSSCCWNPIVYAFMNERFRKAFTNVLVCWRWKRVYPVSKGNNRLRSSTETRKTSTLAEKQGTASGTRQTSETKC